jgi:hypothetical protein
VLADADRRAEELMKAKERARVKKNIKILNTTKMQFKVDKTFKRKTSWKGTSAPVLDIV